MALKSLVFVGTQISVGGAQQMMLSQAEWFAQHGYKISALFFYDKEDLHAEWQAKYSYPIIDLDGWRADQNALRNLFRVIPALWRLARHLRKEKPDVLQTFTPHSDLLGLPIGWVLGVPVRVGSFQGIIQDMPEWQRKLHIRLVNTSLFSKLVGVSKQMAELAFDYGARTEKVTVIPNAVNIPSDEDELLARRLEIRRELEIAENGILALTVGRLAREKGHTYLLDAIPAVIKQHPEMRFVFAGDGYLRDQLVQKVAELELEDDVLFLGIRKDVPALLRAADIFILPSLAEGLPLALLEAMGARLPCIATIVQGSMDLIQTGENGILVPPADPLALENAISDMMDDRRNWDMYRQNARQTIEDYYTVEIVSQRYEKLFVKLLDETA